MVESMIQEVRSSDAMHAVEADQLGKLMNEVLTEERGVSEGCLTFREAKRRLVRSFEREFLAQALVRTRGNISKAARDVQIDRRSFHRLIKKHDINVERLLSSAA